MNVPRFYIALIYGANAVEMEAAARDEAADCFGDECQYRVQRPYNVEQSGAVFAGNRLMAKITVRVDDPPGQGEEPGK